MKEFPLLDAKDIEVKVKQVTKSGAIALLYKTARIDMAMLDATVGVENWENNYKEIDGVLFCGIGITVGERKVWKWSNGIESRSDGEGNERKGEASDAFKRAGFMWGIGRELYTAPFIFLNVDVDEDGKDGKGRDKYKLSDRYATFSVKSITYDINKTITSVVIENNRGVVVFPKSGVKKTPPTEKPESKLPRKGQIKELLNSNGGIYTKDDVTAFMDKRNKQSFDELTDLEFGSLLKLCADGAL